MKKLTYERVVEILHYNEATGVITWKKNRGGGAKAGDIAGSITHQGYIRIRIDDKGYLAHRVAWLYTHGYWAENEIDHINRIKSDNRIENLREVSQICNLRNKNTYSNNKSGVTGVSWNKPSGQWIAKINHNGKQKTLGRFNVLEDAARARLVAEKKYNYPECNKMSSALSFIESLDKKGDDGLALAVVKKD